MHVFGSERGVLATPTRCGTYAVDSTFTPWNAALPEQSVDAVLHDRHRARAASPCPGAPRPFDPGFGGLAGNTAGAHSPFSLEVPGPTGTRTSAGSRSRPRPASPATLERDPLLPRGRRSPLAEAAATPGSTELAPRPARRRARSARAIAGAGAGSRPLHVAGQGLPRRPIQGRAAQPRRRRSRRVSGPYDLGNVVVRARARGSTRSTAQVTAISDPLPQILDGCAAARCARSRSTSTGPDFTLNPTNCDPFSVDGDGHGDEGGQALSEPRSRSRTARSSPSGRSSALRLSGGIKRLGHPAIHATLTAEPGRSQHARSLGDAAAGRAARQLPHRHRLHPVAIRRRHLPGALVDRQRPP